MSELVRDAILACFPKLDTKLSDSGKIMLFKNGKYLGCLTIDFFDGKQPIENNKELQDKVEFIIREILFDVDLD